MKGVGHGDRDQKQRGDAGAAADLLKCSNLVCSEVTAKASAKEARTTTVEWPSEKKKPADIGFPLCISLRVTLLIAAM